MLSVGYDNQETILRATLNIEEIRNIISREEGSIPPTTDLYPFEHNYKVLKWMSHFTLFKCGLY